MFSMFNMAPQQASLAKCLLLWEFAMVLKRGGDGVEKGMIPRDWHGVFQPYDII